MKFIYKSNKFKKIIKKKPRLLNSGCFAEVTVRLDKRIPIEIYENFKAYGNFQISNEFDTLGNGRVQKLIK